MTYFTVIYRTPDTGSEKFSIGVLAPALESALKLFKSSKPDAIIDRIIVGDKAIMWGDTV